MRPQVLFPYFSSIRSIKGLGPRLAPLVERLAGEAVVDLLFHLPSGLIDRRLVAGADLRAKAGQTASVKVTIDRHNAPPKRSRAPYRVYCDADDGTPVILVFFHARPDWITKQIPEGSERIISGRIELYDGNPQIAHPDHMLSVEAAAQMPDFEPVYPATAGLTQRTLTKTARSALATASETPLPEWQDAAWLVKQNWPGWDTALKHAHAPASFAELEASTPDRSRLAYDELLANQLALGLMRRHMRKAKGRALKGTGKLSDGIRAALPFKLTGDQELALADVLGDMAEDTRMLRLLQGDVGSGKTMVAFLALVAAIEAGTQGALMAPTGILCQQHFNTLKPLCDAAGIHLELLTGRDKGKAREAILARLKAGDIDLLVGTHAIFQTGIAFKDLALAVVDEQHRFGVHQRLALSTKGKFGTDVLVMTATPIPRTLALTHYGDMEISAIHEKPPGRTPIETRVMPLERLDDVIPALSRAFEAGARVYWVCPLVEDSELLTLSSVEQRFDHLTKAFPGKVGLVHGQLDAAEKDRVMAAFADGEISLLVATTVIEVGVDVPEATIMVIEHAEHFGLAQLHQLRGRVGRGTVKSSCLLLFQSPLGETAKARLKVMRETNDGFLIAEEDLKLRGAGEILGTRQSGLPVFRLADPVQHRDLISVARDDAQLILERDPELKGERGQALRILLHLFRQDRAVTYLRSG